MAENAKHAQGEWKFEKYNVAGITHGVRVNLPNGFCAFTSALDPDREANARLIAAAPDLLEALSVAEAQMSEACKIAEMAGWTPENGSALKAARAAIAKATEGIE